MDEKLCCPFGGICNDGFGCTDYDKPDKCVGCVLDYLEEISKFLYKYQELKSKKGDK